MKIDFFAPNAANSGSDAKIQLQTWLDQHATAPDFVAIHGGVTAPLSPLAQHVSGTGAVHGASSCLGVMSHTGANLDAGVGVFCIWDPSGSYGTSIVSFDDLDPSEAAARAVTQAIANADRSGEAPDLLWISASPGSEEAVIEGITNTLGEHVPMLGGSAADNDISGQWFMTDGQDQVGNGVIVTALFPSKKTSFAYHNGYAPTQKIGIATKTDGRRVYEIDNRPAAQVYADWTGKGVIDPNATEAQAILGPSTLSPLGRIYDQLGDVPLYLLAHPATALPDGSIEFFADIAEGDALTLMQGSEDSLIARAGKVASLAKNAAPFPASKIAGGLMVYCGGCMLAVQDRMEEVVGSVTSAIPDVPFMGIFTFGEQGCLLDGDNRHGNLMISCLLFEE